MPGTQDCLTLSSPVRQLRHYGRGEPGVGHREGDLGGKGGGGNEGVLSSTIYTLLQCIITDICTFFPFLQLAAFHPCISHVLVYVSDSSAD